MIKGRNCNHVLEKVVSKEDRTAYCPECKRDVPYLEFPDEEQEVEKDKKRLFK